MIWFFKNNKDPEVLLKELESSDLIVREDAFQRLKNHPSDKVDHLILLTLQNYTRYPRYLVFPLIAIAGHRQIADSLEILRYLIKTSDIELRDNAFEALVSLNNQDSLDVLIDLMINDKGELKEKARTAIMQYYSEDALGGLLRAMPNDKTSPAYFEIVAIMEDLELFTALKENFQHPDLNVRNYCYDNLIKFHRADFIPLFIEYYLQVPAKKREEVTRILSEYTPQELIPYFNKAFQLTHEQVLLQLADTLIISRYTQAREEILEFVDQIPVEQFRHRALVDLIQQLDPFTFKYALEILKNASADIRSQCVLALTALIKDTYKRITSPDEPNKLAISRLYDSWEKEISILLDDKHLTEDAQRAVRRVFYVLAENRHFLLKPFLSRFLRDNFQETYLLIKNWSFNEQFDLVHSAVIADPSLASLILTISRSMSDQSLWRIIFKLATYLEDEEDRKIFRKKIVDGNYKISVHQFLKDSDADIRKTAIEIASEMNLQGIANHIVAATKDISPTVRLLALNLLKNNRYPQLEASLKEALADPDEQVVFFAVKEIKKLIPNTNIAPFLINFVNSESEVIRNFALEEVAKISKDKFLKNYKNLSPEIRKMAAKVIQKLDQGFADDIIQDLSSLDPNTRLKAAMLIENIKIGEKGKEALIAAMKDPSKLVRAAIVKNLGILGDNRLITHLVSFVNDPDTRVRANTVEAISSLGDRQAIQILLPFLEDPNNRIRANAVVGIRKIGNFNVTPVLQKMLADSTNSMKASAIWAMGEIGDSAYLGYIFPFFHNQDEMIRYNAFRSVARISPDSLAPYLAAIKSDPSPKIRKLASIIKRN